jgi:hypothetical protein
MQWLSFKVFRFDVMMHNGRMMNPKTRKLEYPQKQPWFMQGRYSSWFCRPGGDSRLSSQKMTAIKHPQFSSK